MHGSPEPYSNAWYRNRLGRIDTTLDRHDNEMREQYQRAKLLAERVAQLERERVMHEAKLGELLGRIEELELLLRAERDRVIAKKNGHANGITF